MSLTFAPIYQLPSTSSPKDGPTKQPNSKTCHEIFHETLCNWERIKHVLSFTLSAKHTCSENIVGLGRKPKPSSGIPWGYGQVLARVAGRAVCEDRGLVSCSSFQGQEREILFSRNKSAGRCAMTVLTSWKVPWEFYERSQAVALVKGGLRRRGTIYGIVNSIHSEGPSFKFWWLSAPDTLW